MSKMSELHLEITEMLEQGASPFDIECIANTLKVPRSLVQDIANSIIPESENYDDLFFA